MKRARTASLILALSLLIGSPGLFPAHAADGELAVSDVVAEGSELKFGDASAAIEWRFRIAADAKVTASLYDSRNVLVRRLEDGTAKLAGDHRLRWDGRDDRGRKAPVGFYLLTIAAAAGDQRVVYDPSDLTGGTLIDASGIRFDVEAGRIRYALPQAALVRIHAGLTNGLLLRTPVDWVARTSGEHAEVWDGFDESQVVDFGRSPELDVQVWAYRLPVNAVVVWSDEVAPMQARPASAGAKSGPRIAATLRSEFLDFEANRERRTVTRQPKLQMYDHWRQDRATARNPKIYLSAPDSHPRQGDAVLVDRPVPIRLHVAESDEAFLQGERFETVIYLDGSFVFEEEQGYLPFTWRVGPETIPPGEHIVTFMIRGYDGHFGSGSIKLYRPAPAVTQQERKPGIASTIKQKDGVRP